MRTRHVSGRESIWDYPHPPAVRSTRRRIQVIHANTLIADTVRALRVCERGHPPTYYVPPEDVRMELLEPGDKKTFCEWKGLAIYYDLYIDDQLVEEVAWQYPEPSRGFESIRDFVAFYADRLDRCLVDGEEVIPEPGSFYGGWITSDIEGPFQ